MKSMTKTLLASLVFAAGSQVALADNILVVMSDEDHLKLKGTDVYETGFYLNELMQPVKMFIDAGHDLTFATPNGLAPTVDVLSDSAMFFGNDEKSMAEHKALLAKLKITDKENSPVISLSRVEQIGYDKFDAVYVPGGHAPMNDLLTDKQMGALLTDFHNKQKVTALVCHGPIALISTLPNAQAFVQSLEAGKSPTTPKDWIYNGYKVTAFSNGEEEASKGWLGGGEMKFYPQDALNVAGATFNVGADLWYPNVVTDRELITGQNPASAVAVATEVLNKLQK
ncbi:type 1 glutamine amidotransferase domain-containing protein [Enterovibrio norvegicus]|uniref:type 1 glutamine amidotransferase domain-containing protein n=1 Tax=Enterovibrio norvegicus TaxID=188144 RepID=UPI000C85E7F0|nr:type 1 glutamine amidotransferase domain-containing protein [Enterovibrio norvegicus]PMN72440.1 thiamine biosynthesis protein ThiJ [Enterovibrio norvegicus]